MSAQPSSSTIPVAPRAKRLDSWRPRLAASVLTEAGADADGSGGGHAGKMIGDSDLQRVTVVQGASILTARTEAGLGVRKGSLDELLSSPPSVTKLTDEKAVVIFRRGPRGEFVLQGVVEVRESKMADERARLLGLMSTQTKGNVR